ncbi:MAG: hypothetical protein LBP72_06085 [Dysgonamonadaceae bacterium]|nr:hypothetical protein [Dysgonamonadaceae bacterium]
MRALSFLNKQRTIEAVSIFEDLFERHPDAPLKLAECKMKQGLEYLSYDKVIAKSFFEQVIDIKKQAPPKAQKKSFDKLEKRAYLEIAKIDFNLIINEPFTQKKLYRIHENLQFIDNAPQKGFENDFFAISQKYTQELAELYYFFGKNCEKERQLIEAVQFYTKVINLANVPVTLKNDASARLGICKLKQEEESDENLLGNIENASEEIKRDFYFRYAKNLIREKNFEKAESIIQEQLNIDSPVIEKLKKIIHSTKIETVKSKIDQINQTIDSFYENTFTMDDLKQFYDSLDAEINIIKTVIPTISEKLNQMKPNLFNRLLTNYIEEKKFANAINIIQKYPSFWENPELLKNLGICSYGYASQGNLDEKNYKIIISYFLTAVYSEKAMIKSLEQISRKDNYTYTLVELITTCKYPEKLPSNINYDDVSETNISIGATQKELLAQFESLLSQKINNPNLINIAHSFFSSEKEATERLIKVVNKDILCASPYFARIFGINKTLTTILTEIYENDKNEDALEAGIPYITEDSNAYIKSYAIVKELIYKAVKAIQNEDLAELKLLNSRGKSNLVTEYTQIATKAEELLFKSIASKINNSYEDDRLIPLMEETICFSSKNEKLRRQYSVYIANFCINKINAGVMDNSKALALMKSAYMYSPDNARICRNFITLIKFNLIDIVNNKAQNITEIYRLLDETYSNRSTTFKQESVELEKVRNDILNELSKKGADLSLFEDSQASNLMAENNSNARIEKTKEVLSYLKKLSEI